MIMSQGLRDMKHTDMNFMNLNIFLAISNSKGSNSLHAVTNLCISRHKVRRIFCQERRRGRGLSLTSRGCSHGAQTPRASPRTGSRQSPTGFY